MERGPDLARGVEICGVRRWGWVDFCEKLKGRFDKCRVGLRMDYYETLSLAGWSRL